jgi:hypothetical protein
MRVGPPLHAARRLSRLAVIRTLPTPGTSITASMRSTVAVSAFGIVCSASETYGPGTRSRIFSSVMPEVYARDGSSDNTASRSR